MTDQAPSAEPKNPLREIVQPFVDLARAPRALWGINLGYLIEGCVYFGMLGYLAMYFTDHVFRGMPDADKYSHPMVGVLTAGITIAMLFLGGIPDRFGVRRALLAAFTFMVFGRVLIAGGSTIFGLEPHGLWSALHLVTMAGIMLVVIGYGMFQPAAYAGVRQFTTPKTAGMGYAMLYALMNLGGWLPTFAFLLRDEKRGLGLGIPGTFWVYTGLTVVALVATALILTPRVVREAIARAKAETAAALVRETSESEQARENRERGEMRAGAERIPLHIWSGWILLAILAGALLDGWLRLAALATWLTLTIVVVAVRPLRLWVARHPLADVKFFAFIFALIPVQTLFVYNWLILPQYINRAYEGWIGEEFEVASNFNPLLIFVLVPIITALTERARVYNMMIYGTFVMAAPAFFLALGPRPETLLAYIVVMTIGEAMWQPRFLQYAAEIAPEGRTGIYMGVAQFPWFLTKVIVPLYSGWMMTRYCPPEGVRHTETMWLIFGAIAMISPLVLLLAKGWLGRGFKVRAD